jgi:RNA polymerase sigma factor (TIGR02999 family)
MTEVAPGDVTEMLRRVQAGDRAAENELVARLYRDLRTVAARRMRREPPDHTWQPTVLVDEALLRLRNDGTFTTAADGAFLLKAAARAMHQLLVDHHRIRTARKRGGRSRKHPLDVAFDHLATVAEISRVELHDELERLSQVDERACMVVHFRFYLGMSPADVAEALGISQKTVERDWRFARAWLRDRLKPTESP